jgi:Glycosyl hydrolases family 16
MVSFEHFAKVASSDLRPGRHSGFYWAVPEMNRRRMMLMTGFGALAAAIPVPDARAYPSWPDTPADRVPPPTAPPDGAAQGTYLFHDEFNGPAGSAPDPSKWTVSRARESMQDPTFWELPENVGQYRDDRRNVFLDGKSNLVIRAAKDGNTYYSGKVFSPWEGGIGTTWEARIKLNCLTAGCWPAWWLSSDAQGEIDILEWYGNGTWASGTTVHSKANGAEWATHKLTFDSAWHTWRMQWDDAGMRFWKDYVDGAQPYFNVPAHSIAHWPFNDPGYRVFPILNLAVAGSGGGDPGPGTYPAEMLVDWLRVW